ncbi:MAG: DUF87 domain-containing protein [Planctomycetota bacterium]
MPKVKEEPTAVSRNGESASEETNDVMPIGSPPESAFEALLQDSETAGGEFIGDPADAGSFGRTMFDAPSAKDGTVTVLIPKDRIDAVCSQSLVRIESRTDNRTYMGAIVEGPFAEPDGLRADATPMVITAVNGGLLIPKYHGRAQIEIIGERLPTGSIVPPRRRPKPNSPVFALDADDTKKTLGIKGDFRLGLADGFEDLDVTIDGKSKAVFPRHVGVLGTTGGGKSTTVSGMVNKAQLEGKAVILIDTEGEYTSINEPTSDAGMKESLERLGQQPAGVQGTKIVHLVGKDTSNPAHPSRSQFSLQFCKLSPFAIQEILDLSEGQAARFWAAYDIAKLALEKFGVWPINEAEKIELMELDEMESGYPKMTLAHLYDIIKEIGAMVDKDGSEPSLDTGLFEQRRKELHGIIKTLKTPKDVRSWRALQGKLGKLRRLKIFDSPNAPELDYDSMLKPGTVTIVDLSDTDSPQINNLVIAELLRGVQIHQERNYQRAVTAGTDPTSTVIFIEEAHEFLSADRIKKMEVLFQQVARIARRGRKRWLGMVFITQLPQHLPDEVCLALCLL